MALLECIHLVKKFGGVVATSDVNISIDENDMIGLIGPNGAGKTTLFNLISGLYKPTSGEIKFKGREIGRMSASKRCKIGIARTFQLVQPFKV